MVIKNYIYILIFICIVVLPPKNLHAETVWEKVATEKGLDPYDLYAIALIESRRVWNDHQVRPWLYTMMIQGKKNASVFLPDKDSAIILLNLLLQNGVKNVDVCCMQINLATHMNKVKNPADLFDLDTCIDIGGDILKVALQSTDDRELGLGRYHHWRHENRSRSYGKKVIALSEALRGLKIFDAQQR